MAKKKISSDEALAKIKVLTNEFYADVGKHEFWGKDINMEILVSEIDNIISQTKINGKLVLVEQLKRDESKENHADGNIFLGIDFSKSFS